MRRSLEKDQTLVARLDELPRTIKDAMSLTKSVGEQYLWVDSLCIIQDDPDDKEHQIAAMSHIYTSAALTIAIVSGDHANAGLAGMSAGPRTFPQRIKEIQGIYLANRCEGLTRAVDELFWNIRAWTL